MKETEPECGKMICGMISAEESWFARARERLVEEFGPVDRIGDVMPFDFTGYYDAETGTPLFRMFLSFTDLIAPDSLPEIKRWTNDLEDEFASLPDAAVPRPVNIDPGYITPSKLVLASMKDFSHRICLDGGVFAEITLLYNKGWRTLPWTFPDYGSGRYEPFLTEAREGLLAEIRK